VVFKSQTLIFLSYNSWRVLGISSFHRDALSFSKIAVAVHLICIPVSSRQRREVEGRSLPWKAISWTVHSLFLLLPFNQNFITWSPPAAKEPGKHNLQLRGYVLQLKLGVQLLKKEGERDIIWLLDISSTSLPIRSPWAGSTVQVFN
jgi:hypothetical protein